MRLSCEVSPTDAREGRWQGNDPSAKALLVKKRPYRVDLLGLFDGLSVRVEAHGDGCQIGGGREGKDVTLLGVAVIVPAFVP